MDWIHCNSCFVQCKPGLSLFLTSCGHMFCQNCINTVVKGGQCSICRSECTTVKLAPDMPPDVQDFFSEPEELMTKLSTVLDFQRKHRMRLTNHWINVANKFGVARDEVKRLNALCRKLNDVVKELQQKNRNLKAQLEQKTIISGGISPFATTPCMAAVSPTLTPQCLSRPAKSTPFNRHQSNLITPSRITKHRPNSGNGSMNGTIHKCNSGGMFLTPSPPSSAGSGYHSSDTPFKSPTSPDITNKIILATIRRNPSSM